MLRRLIRVLMILPLLVACSMQNEWKGGPDEYMQLYKGPKKPAAAVARVRMAEPNFTMLSGHPFFMSVSGTRLSREGDVYATKRFEVLPGKYKIDVSLIYLGGLDSPFDDRWYETGDGTIEADLEAGHLYEVTMSDEGTKLYIGQPHERHLWVSLDDKTTQRAAIPKQEISYYWPQLGRGQTPPEPRRNLFERIDDMPSGTKVTMVQSPSQSGGLNTRVVAPKGVSIPSDAEVVPPKLEFDEDQIRAQASELQLQGEVTVRFDVSEKGKVSNVRIISEAKGETVDAVKEIIVSSTAQPGTVDSKPAAFKDVEAQISFENTGQTGKTLLKIAAVVVLVPIAIILGLASGGGGFSFGD